VHYTTNKKRKKTKTWTFQFLLAIAECIAPLSHHLGVCSFVRLTHSWSVSKRCKLGSRNFHCWLPQEL